MHPPDFNITLTGFMGVGKSCVGREVARRLNRPFVDMDVEIERRAGKPISAIFAQDGESTFRALESRLCRELSKERGLVIATGGGTLVNDDNRRRMMACGPLFCLTCTVDEILRRLSAAHDRPLLDVEDRRRRIENLLARRREAYAAIPRQIDTTSLSVEQVAEQVIAEAFSILLPVRHPAGSYPIHIGHGLLERVGELMRGVNGGAVAIVTNPTIAVHHLPPLLRSLRDAGHHPFVCTIPDGERYKTLDTVADLYAQFVQGGLDRSGAVVALGGGVVCDVAGFAAATYMRGVPVVQVPTTLLAMVDASVGGKTGVDLPQGKNLVGAFKQPSLVVIDPTTLYTLPTVEVAAGMAELIKHGVIDDAELFADLSKPASGEWDRWIARSLQVKIAVVEQDPFERGRRAVLNLGHTVGHALEQVGGFSLRHGEGVSIGMVAAARIAAALGMANPELIERLTATLQRHKLPTTCPPFTTENIWQAMKRDKKKRGHKLRWILPRTIGKVEIVDDVPEQVVSEVLCAMGARRVADAPGPSRLDVSATGEPHH